MKDDELKIIMTILGVKNIQELSEVDLIILDDVKAWCQARDIDCNSFANRQKNKTNKRD